MNEGSEEWAEEAERRKADAERIDHERAGEVLPDDAAGAPGDRERLDEAQEVVAEEHHVRALARDIRTRAHADADARRRERRRVVDAIADHRDCPAGGNQRLDPLQLVFG